MAPQTVTALNLIVASGPIVSRQKTKGPALTGQSQCWERLQQTAGDLSVDFTTVQKHQVVKFSFAYPNNSINMFGK